MKSGISPLIRRIIKQKLEFDNPKKFQLALKYQYSKVQSIKFKFENGLAYFLPYISIKKALMGLLEKLNINSIKKLNFPRPASRPPEGTTLDFSS